MIPIAMMMAVAICAQPLGVVDAAPQSSDLRLAQAQAPGRPVGSGDPKTAPDPPVRDRVAPTEPPSPGRPNFPQRPDNEPALKNPLK